TVKQLCADDSAATSVKVGYRQACYSKKPLPVIRLGFFYVCWFILQILLVNCWQFSRQVVFTSLSMLLNLPARRQPGAAACGSVR
ncbi:hypothetical protein, partial [Janthinobacterium rivuli]|uniref:hypothetical protein n=1 Tax=Janthinobacterium sp. FT68W TaxID=2654255 RepID=UPI001D0319A0